MLIRKCRVLATALVVAALSLLVVSPALAGAAPWAAPADLSATGQSATRPKVTVDSTGRAIAVWIRPNGTNNIIQSSWSLNGGPWSTPANLSAAGRNADEPEVTVDSTGLATAVWSRYDGTNYFIQSSTSLNGAAWVPAPANLSAAGQDADVPKVTVDSTGRAIAVWRRYDGFNNIIQSSTSLNGAAWVPAPANLTPAGQDAGSPQVTVDATGRAIAVWSRYDGTNYIIQSSTSLNGAAWVPAPANLSAAGQSADVPKVTVDSTGRAIAVWHRYDGFNDIIQSSRSLNGAAWVPAPANLTPAGQDAGSPEVTVDATGRAIAVWPRYDGTNYFIQSSTSLNGAAWVPAPANLSAAGQDAVSARVTVDATGRAIAIWARYDGTNWVMQSSTSLNGAAWVPAPANLTPAGQDADRAGVTVDSTGRAIAIWRRYDGTNWVIQSSATVTAVPAPAPALAATGVSIVVPLGVAAVLLLAGACVVVLRRRTKNG